MSQYYGFSLTFRFNKVFKELGTCDEAQIQMLKSIHDLWHERQQMIVVLVTKMMKTDLISVAAIANWIFSEDMIRDFTRYTHHFT